MSTPGIVFAAQFITAASANTADLQYSGHALGYLGRADAYLNQKEELTAALEQIEMQYYSGHALGYLGREKATDLFKTGVMEQGHKIYFGSPGEGMEEHSAGVFTAAKDSLTEQEVSDMQFRFDASQHKDCPLYTTVISFDNPFLEKYGINYHTPEGKRALKEYTRLGVANLIRYSQLDESNTVWTAAIHYNTDNIHIHVDLVEKEKVNREKDMLPVIAFDKLKSAVMNKIVDNQYTIELENVIRKNLLQGIKEQTYDPDILTELLQKLPRNVPWEYNRQGMKPYQQLIRKNINNIIKSSPSLSASWKQLNKDLGEYETFLRDLYGEGKRDLAKRGANNKLSDFYTRVGNAILKAADELRPDYEEKERLRRQAETPVSETADIVLEEAPVISEDFKNIPGERTEREKNEEDYELPEEPTQPDDKAENRIRYNLLEQQVLNGDINAYYRLACMMRAGTVNAPNSDAATELFSYAATKGHAAAAYQLGKIHSEDRQKKDPELARYWFERAANVGHDGAMYQLGKLHEQTDPGISEMWYRKASEQQNAWAALRLAELYKTGKLEDDEQLGQQYQHWAFLLLERKDEKSEIDNYTHYQLGRMYEQGLGTERNVTEAVYQFISAREYPPALQEAVRMSCEKTVMQELTAAAEQGDERARLASLLLNECRSILKPYAEFTDPFRQALKTLRDGDYKTAMPLMETEYFTGNAYAAAELGRVYQRGLGVDTDTEKAFDYYKQVYDGMLQVNQKKPNPYLQYRIGKLVQQGLGTEANPEKALEWFLKSAGQGNKFAQFSAGSCYYSGTGCEQDYDEARTWFELAVAQDNAFALYKLGVMAEQGQGMNIEDEKAFSYYAKAFSLFRVQADETKDEQLQYRLGMMAWKGKGTQSNPPLAVEYFEKSAKQGNEDAKAALAKLYLKGDGIEKNVDRAIALLTELAEKDDQAQYTLGRLYLLGEEVRKDTQKAVHYLGMAADQGNQFAQYALGRLYLSGMAVPADTIKGVRYLQAAADQKNQYAQYALGVYYIHNGQGAKGVKLLSAAAAQGNEYADKAMTRLQEHHAQLPKKKLQYTVSRHQYTQKAQRSLRRLARDYNSHIKQLTNEFEYEQELQEQRQLSR